MNTFEFITQLRDKYFFDNLSKININDLETAYEESKKDLEYLENINNVPFILEHIRNNKNIAKTEIRVILLLIEDLMLYGFRRELPLSYLMEKLSISDCNLSTTLSILEQNKYITKRRVDTKHKVVRLVFESIF